jgi:hypothetical protein
MRCETRMPLQKKTSAIAKLFLARSANQETRVNPNPPTTHSHGTQIEDHVDGLTTTPQRHRTRRFTSRIEDSDNGVVKKSILKAEVFIFMPSSTPLLPLNTLKTLPYFW